MTSDYLTLANILTGFGILGGVLTAWNYIQKPQIKSDKREELLGEQYTNLNEKLTMLSKDFQLHVTQDLQSMGLINSTLVANGKDIVRISTILEERLPRNERT